MNVNINCAALSGVIADAVTVEVDLAKGLPAFSIVGLPEGAVKESKVRVLAALNNCGYLMPPRKVTVNLAPANLKKSGSAFDLAIALGILGGLELLDPSLLEKSLVIGELGLDGALRSIPGALPYSMLARKKGFEKILTPSDNAKEAAVVDDVEIFPIKDLPQAVMHLNGYRKIHSQPKTEVQLITDDQYEDMSDVKGQENAKRAMEVAAAGSHNVMMIGPPGSGKTMLARRFPGIMPPLTFEEMLEVSATHSVLGLTSADKPLICKRPFRAPHHTVSDAGLVGGCNPPRPGEVSLAHNGILFLDELPEFKRHVLEVLREPLEEGVITISRAGGQSTFMSDFTMVASMNPCPCGYYGSRDRICICTPNSVDRYRSKISGPLLDRIDLHVEVPAVPVKYLSSESDSEQSSKIRNRVLKARNIQIKRFEDTVTRTNAQMNLKQIKKFCKIDSRAQGILESAIDRLGLSARAYTRILKVARTIADLEEKKNVDFSCIAEAIGYRTLDKSKDSNF